jgi:hypothetical protein
LRTAAGAAAPFAERRRRIGTRLTALRDVSPGVHVEAMNVIAASARSPLAWQLGSSFTCFTTVAADTPAGRSSSDDARHPAGSPPARCRAGTSQLRCVGGRSQRSSGDGRGCSLALITGLHLNPQRPIADRLELRSGRPSGGIRRDADGGLSVGEGASCGIARRAIVNCTVAPATGRLFRSRTSTTGATAVPCWTTFTEASPSRTTIRRPPAGVWAF